jgi:hypothetical protein
LDCQWPVRRSPPVLHSSLRPLPFPKTNSDCW